jgi:hypothetical protein
MVASENYDPSRKKWNVVRLRRRAYLAITIASIILPILFTYLSFRSVPLNDVARSLSDVTAALLLWKLILATYFLLWVAGTRTDASDQELVYREVPNEGKIGTSAYAVIIGICIFGAVLLWSPNFEFFVGALSLIWLFNIFAWQYLVRTIVRPSIDRSSKSAQEVNDLIGEEELGVVGWYLCGAWQWYRFTLGILIISALWGLVYIKRYNLAVLGLPGLLSWELIQALGMIVFVLCTEVWIWSERARMKLSLGLLEGFRDRYVLSRKKSAS